LEFIKKVFMDKEKIMRLTNDNKGWVTLTGYALNRSVRVEGEPIGGGYQWGYRSNKSSQLAKAILPIFTNKPVSVKMISNFDRGILAQLPKGNFNVRLNIDRVLGILLGENVSKKKHSHQLIQIGIGDSYYSKLLDFVSMPYRTCLFEQGTVEYDLLEQLNEEQIQEIKDYTAKYTIRKEPNNEGGTKEVYTEFLGKTELKPREGAYVVRKGMGTGINKGLDSKEYGVN